jgi:hypothetical protein
MRPLRGAEYVVKVYSIIVCYRPDLPVLGQICDNLMQDGAHVIIVDNTEVPYLLDQTRSAECQLITLGRNTGIAHAQNVGVTSAIAAGAVSWTGYLSSTGVYGDTGGAWVDESAPVGEGRRTARAQADLAWQALRHDVRVFRLPGIYGPGRSALERVTDGKAHRIDMPGQIFSRVHVDDIVDAVRASFDGPAGVYNIADDAPASQNAVIEYACDLLQLEWPPLLSIEAAGLSPMARGFYAENRRVANGKAKRLLNWQPRYAHYRSGLGACIATIRPSIANALPASASVDQT